MRNTAWASDSEPQGCLWNPMKAGSTGLGWTIEPLELPSQPPQRGCFVWVCGFSEASKFQPLIRRPLRGPLPEPFSHELQWGWRSIFQGCVSAVSFPFTLLCCRWWNLKTAVTWEAASVWLGKSQHLLQVCGVSHCLQTLFFMAWHLHSSSDQIPPSLIETR